MVHLGVILDRAVEVFSLVQKKTEKKPLGGEPDTTNNRMELISPIGGV
jgi:ribonuclease HI